MKNLFGAGATAFLTCLDMAVKSEVEKWPDEEEKPFADSKKIVLRKVHLRRKRVEFNGKKRGKCDGKKRRQIDRQQ